MIWLGLIVLAVVAGLVLRKSLHRTDPPLPGNVATGGKLPEGGPLWEPPSVDGYVGSQACAACHVEITEAFQTHPMSRSLDRIEREFESRVGEAGVTRVIGKQRVLDVELRDGAMRHHERMFDASGEEIYDQAVTIAYVVGSGRRAKAYLHRRGGLLFMSPLNWYARSQEWDLAPGYKPDDPRRFDRRVTDECLACHAGRVAPAGRSLNQYRDPAFSELSIGCENCHGPGKQHVALRRSDLAAARDDDSIVNPARLDADRRESVCNQCHLQTAARVPRYGRSDLDFRPGQRLEDIWTAFDQGSSITGDGRTRSVSHVQQMRDSRCYAASDGRFGCTSCHDPHRVPPAGERDAFYRERCLRCHKSGSCTETVQRREEREDSCIFCHMPSREASNVSHVTQTDHRVVRTALASGAGRREEEESDDSLAFLDRADLRLDDWERDRALGLAAWKHLSKLGKPRPRELIPLLEGVLDRVPDDGTVLTAVGSLALESRLNAQARACFERARKIPASEEAATAGLLDIDYLASAGTALAYADRLLEIDSGDARVHALRADILARTGRTGEGIDAARRSLQHNPTLIPVRQWLVNALRVAGRDDEARQEEQILLRMQQARPPPR